MSEKSALESSGVFKYSSVLKNKGALLVLEVQRSPAATRQESGFGGYEQAYRAQRDGYRAAALPPRPVKWLSSNPNWATALWKATTGIIHDVDSTQEIPHKYYLRQTLARRQPGTSRRRWTRPVPWSAPSRTVNSILFVSAPTRRWWREDDSTTSRTCTLVGRWTQWRREETHWPDSTGILPHCNGLLWQRTGGVQDVGGLH